MTNLPEQQSRRQGFVPLWYEAAKVIRTRKDVGQHEAIKEIEQMRVSWNYGRGLVAFTATLLVLQGASNAIAQFAPLGNQQPAIPQNQTQVYSPYQNQGYLPNQTLPQTLPPVQAVPQNQAAYQNQAVPQQTLLQNQAVARYQGAPQQQVRPQTGPQYTAIAMLQGGGQPAGQAAGEAMLSPVPNANGGYPMQSAPGCSTCQSAPATSYGGCATGNCGGYGYNTFDNSCGSGRGCSGIGLGARRGCGRQWFGGVYGLYMGREGNDWIPLGFSTLATNGPGYYHNDTETALNLRSVDNDFQYGAEVRLGFTFGGAGACGCGPRFALEGVYWALDEDQQAASVSDTSADANRLYGMIDYSGIQANMGAGLRALNHYFDYGSPTSDYTNGGALDEIQVRSLSVRSNFSIQNLELNVLRLPTFGGGCATGSCGCDSGGCSTGGCCSTDGCCTTGGCGAPRYSLSTSLGARYIRIDDDFYFRSDWENVTTPGTGFAAMDVQADNHLVGFQLGCNGTYRIGCSGRWALHCSANTGIYGNHMEVTQRVDVPTAGSVEYANGGAFGVDTDDDGVSFAGELRLGASYQYSCNWRLFGGYRAMGITGLALSFDQLQSSDYATAASASYVSSTGSIFLHGLQTGVECTY